MGHGAPSGHCLLRVCQTLSLSSRVAGPLAPPSVLLRSVGLRLMRPSRDGTVWRSASFHCCRALCGHHFCPLLRQPLPVRSLPSVPLPHVALPRVHRRMNGRGFVQCYNELTRNKSLAPMTWLKIKTSPRHVFVTRPLLRLPSAIGLWVENRTTSQNPEDTCTRDTA